MVIVPDAASRCFLSGWTSLHALSASSNAAATIETSLLSIFDPIAYVPGATPESPACATMRARPRPFALVVWLTSAGQSPPKSVRTIETEVLFTAPCVPDCTTATPSRTLSELPAYVPLTDPAVEPEGEGELHAARAVRSEGTTKKARRFITKILSRGPSRR